MTTIEGLKSELSDILDDLEDVDVSIDRLEALMSTVRAEIQALEKPDYKFPSKKIQEGIIGECGGYALAILKQEFVKAQIEAEYDVPDILLEHLLKLVGTKVTPRMWLVSDGVSNVDLLGPCLSALGSVNDWFAAVQAAREAGGFGLTTPSEAEDPEKEAKRKMMAWIQIFDGQGSTYVSTVRLRAQFISEIAPYWYFLEHGNEDFASDEGLSPYPRYGPPNAVTQSEIKTEKYIDDRLKDTAANYDDEYGDGLKERRRFLRALEKIAYRLETIPLDRVRELVEEQIQQYHGIDGFDAMDDKTIDRILARVVEGIKYREQRITVPGLPGSGRIRLRGIMKEIRLLNLQLSEIYLEEIGL